MRYSLLAAELLLASPAYSLLELPVQKRDKHTSGRTADRARGLTRRAGTLETTLFSGIGFVSGGAYYANITIGTPPQPLTVLLDTGSSDLYVDVAASCPSADSNHPCLGGTFVPSVSKSIKILSDNTAFNASYGDGSTAVGPYALDTVCVNDICVEQVQFGLAETIKATVGPATSLLGIGSYVIEATRNKYRNFPLVLAGAGIVNSALFSLYLNSYDSLTGSILFGGIDTDKFTGDLVTTDTLPDPVSGYVDQFITAITALKVTVGGNSKSIFTGGAPGAAAYKSGTPSLPVLLDSGSSAWSVPSRYYEAIVSQFTYVDPKTGIGSCKYADSGDSVTLTINGAVDITVDVSNFYLPLYNPDNNQPEYISQGEQACGFEIVPSAGTGEGFEVMGDAMLRAMYVVYDLDLGQISIAQAANGSTSNVVAVEAGEGGVAKAAGSSGKNAPTNSYSVAPSIRASGSYAYSTAKSTIGTATGEAAIPTAARVSGQSSSGSGSGSSGSDQSHGAAPSVLPPMRWNGLGSAAAAVAMMCLGAALVL